MKWFWLNRRFLSRKKRSYLVGQEQQKHELQHHQNPLSLEVHLETKLGEPSKEERNVLSEIIVALKQCGNLHKGKSLHSVAIARGCDTDTFAGTALIQMYIKHGSMPFAQDVFDKMPRHDVVTWTCLILGYVENGENTRALELFTDMDCKPDSFTFVSVIKACGNLAKEKPFDRGTCLLKGAAIHKQLQSERLEKNIFVASSLVDMYSKCGDMVSAQKVFDEMLRRDAVSWNCLILGYVDNGQSVVALELFMTMDVRPDYVTFVGALKACSALATRNDSMKHLWLERGKAIHHQLRVHGYESNVVVGTMLINMYSKCGSILYARGVFDGMKERNAVMWNSLILGYVENGETVTALELFTSMDCEPDSLTFVAALKACVGLAEQFDKQLGLRKGYSIHRKVKELGVDSNILVSSTLVHMYSKCGDIQSARDVFDTMPQRNLVVWTSLMLGYVEDGSSSVAIDLFANMDCEPDQGAFVAALKACIGFAESEKELGLRNGMILYTQIKARSFEKDTVVANTLLEMFCKLGAMQPARQVFESMLQHDVVAWTCLILGYVESGESSTAWHLFTSMDCEPNSVTLVAALKACGNEALLAAGKHVHAWACKLGLEQDDKVSTSLVDFYGKCSNMISASQVFNGMNKPDIVSWNALLAGHSILGETIEVFKLATMIEEAGLRLNSSTFTSILTACSHAGMVEEAKKYFRSMSRWSICPGVEQYTCMVDMFGRANRLQEALEVIESMPVDGDAILWKSLLAACRKWNNLEVGQVAFGSLVSKNANDPAAYVLLRDMYKRKNI